MWNAKVNKTEKQAGINITLEELIALRGKLIGNSRNIKKATRELFSGPNFAKIRGRGLDFDATREYQPGDDIRHMAWRVTARSLKPHIKIYHEEKERPVWLAVDLSPSLYFGTRCMFKSVSSIKQAAILGWSYLQKRERIGAVIATTEKIFVYKPQTREREFLAILNALTKCSNNQPTFTEKNCLHDLLLNMQQQVRSGNSIYILSDFFQFDERNQKLILHFAQRAQVVLVFVYDPFEASSPPAYQYVVTDGKNRVLFNMDNAQNRDQYQQQFKLKQDELIEFSRKHSIPLQILCTDQEEQV